MIRPGEPWGSPTSSAPDLEVAGGDRALATAVAGSRGALVRFHPDATSDIARAVGLAPGAARDETQLHGTALPLDLLALGDGVAANMCVFGVPPDRLRWWSRSLEIEIRLDGRAWFAGRATTVVVATGQFLRGLDVVPRGHPGDGKAEVQVYDLGRRDRRPMRTKLAVGAHLPHPRIRSRTATRVDLHTSRPVALEIDGATRPPASDAGVEVVPGAYRLLI